MNLKEKKEYIFRVEGNLIRWFVDILVFVVFNKIYLVE